MRYSCICEKRGIELRVKVDPRRNYHHLRTYDNKKEARIIYQVPAVKRPYLQRHYSNPLCIWRNRDNPRLQLLDWVLSGLSLPRILFYRDVYIYAAESML